MQYKTVVVVGAHNLAHYNESNKNVVSLSTRVMQVMMKMQNISQNARTLTHPGKLIKQQMYSVGIHMYQLNQIWNSPVEG